MQQAQTDVIPEQVAGGADGPAPTPGPDTSAKVDQGDAGVEETAQPEVIEGDKELEQVDEGVAEAKGEDVERKDTPVVQEVGGEGDIPVADDSAAAVSGTSLQAEEAVSAAAPVKREQQRIENPIYTLEVIGNKHKTDAFWLVLNRPEVTHRADM